MSFKIVTWRKYGDVSVDYAHDYNELVRRLHEIDGAFWDIKPMDNDPRFEKYPVENYLAESEEATCVITPGGPAARKELEDLIKYLAKPEAQGNGLIKNYDDVGTGPVYLITGERETGWDYQWNPEDPNYDPENPGNYKA